MNSVTEKQLRAQVEASRNNAAALAALDHRLQAIREPWGGPLRLKVIALKRTLDTSQHASSHWGVPFGLPQPDGRPLYGYRLSSAAFPKLQAHLETKARPGRIATGGDKALFVLWAAEWFRRSYKGGVSRWDDVGEAIGLRLGQAEWRALADDGLRMWRVAPMRLGGVTYRLRNLARQGGFPVAAVEDGANAWATAYLGRLVGILLHERAWTAERAYRHAEALGTTLPSTWQSPDFYTLAADLAGAVATLRRRAEEGGALGALAPSDWLDANEPDWRDRLPLVIDSAAGRRLVDGLMHAAATRGGTATVRLVRLMMRTGNEWQPRLRLDLEGAVPLPGRHAEEWSRLRLYAAGELSRYLPGELAVLEPDGNGGWLSAPARPGAAACEVPLDVPLTFEVRGDRQRVDDLSRMPGSAAVAGPFLVCHADAEEAEDAPSALVVAGASAGKYRANPLFLFTPSGWVVAGSVDGAVQRLPASGAWQLWRVSEGGAVLASPQGDRYAVLSGQSAEQRDELILHARPPAACRHADGVALSLGRPEPWVRDRETLRSPKPREIVWRRAGQSQWRPFAGFDGQGTCEFAWRDGATTLLRDRRSCTVLPADFCVAVERLGGVPTVTVAGWPGHVHVEPGQHAGPGQWRVLPDGLMQSDATVLLGQPGAEPVPLKVRLPHAACLATWAGELLPRKRRLGLAELSDLVARASGRCQLHARLLDRNRRRVPQAALDWWFDDELALGSIRDDLSALLRPLGELDATMELQFNTSPDVWFVCESAMELQATNDSLCPTRAVPDGARVVARALHDPAVERDITPGGPARGVQEFRAGADLPGCLLIYLRLGERVLSRPFWLTGPPLSTAPPNRLGEAMAVADKNARMGQLAALYDDAEADGPAGRVVMKQVAGLVASLAGLPPSTFDALSLLPSRPLALARLAFEAPDQDLRAVLRLAEGLPMAWPLVPKACWDKAANWHLASILAAIPPEITGAPKLAAGEIGRRARAIAAEEPALAVLFRLSADAVTLPDAAQFFMQLAHDDASHAGRSPFRPSLTPLLPDWQRFDDLFWRALDAPCAAALAVAGRARLTDDQVRCVKDVARRHPRYFKQAFTARWKELIDG